MVVAEDGWCSGDNACKHGMDLRMFIEPGFKSKTLKAAVRFSDYACIGRGLAPSVHGGAIESAMDEATAETAKSKLFPYATTVSLDFKIKKAPQPHTTYLLKCEVTKEHLEHIKYDVTCEMRAIDDDGQEIGGIKGLMGSCLAVMVNPARLG